MRFGFYQAIPDRMPLRCHHRMPHVDHPHHPRGLLPQSVGRRRGRTRGHCGTCIASAATICKDPACHCEPNMHVIVDAAPGVFETVTRPVVQFYHPYGATAREQLW